MLLIHRHPFGVSRHLRRTSPAWAEQVLAQGLVLPLRLRFECWLSGRPVEADAFLDTGADTTVISLRWAAALGDTTGLGKPILDPSHRFVEEVYLEIGAHTLPLPLTVHGPRLCRQQGDTCPSGWTEEGWRLVPEIAGYEDILLGRDFFAAHGLLLLVDYGVQPSFSLLHPQEEEGRACRNAILQAFEPPPPLKGIAHE